MAEPSVLAIYLRLARLAADQMRLSDRDRWWVLAGVQALEDGFPLIAAHCRQLVVAHNPGHMLRKWPNLADALADDGFRHLHQRLLRRYPIEHAETELDVGRIDMRAEAGQFHSDEEFLAHLLNVDWKWLCETYGD